MSARPEFSIVDEDVPPRPQPQAGAGLLMLALKTLSQRTVVSLANLFTLATVASVFWLFLSIRNPGSFELAQMYGYAVFVLGINFIVRRK